MTQANITGYRFAGDLEIRSMLFVTSTGQTLDVSSLIIELNIYQDINEHYLQCEAVFSDALRLFHTIENGFTGAEMLIVSFRNRTDLDDIEFNDYVFGLYELSDRQQLDQDEVYLLSGISIEAYSSTVQKISRAYGRNSSTTITNMIENISNEFILSDSAKTIYRDLSTGISYTIDKQIDLEQTEGLHSLIIPDLSVDGSIDFLINEADSVDHIPLFVFYEDKDGFKLRNISTLVEQEATATYAHFPFNFDLNNHTVSNEKEYDFERIMSFAVIKQTNLLENAQKGLFKSTVTQVDLHKKSFNTTTFDYKNNKFKSLNSGSILGSITSDSSVDITMTSRKEQDASDTYYAKEQHRPKKIDQFYSQRQAYKRHIFNTIIEVTIPGNSELTVGQTLTLKFPIINDIQDTAQEVDKYLSGQYLITKLRHKMTGKDDAGFLTILECTKDTGVET